MKKIRRRLSMSGSGAGPPPPPPAVEPNVSPTERRHQGPRSTLSTSTSGGQVVPGVKKRPSVDSDDVPLYDRFTALSRTSQTQTQSQSQLKARSNTMGGKDTREAQYRVYSTKDVGGVGGHVSSSLPRSSSVSTTRPRVPEVRGRGRYPTVRRDKPLPTPVPSSSSSSSPSQVQLQTHRKLTRHRDHTHTHAYTPIQGQTQGQTLPTRSFTSTSKPTVEKYSSLHTPRSRPAVADVFPAQGPTFSALQPVSPKRKDGYDDADHDRKRRPAMMPNYAYNYRQQPEVDVDAGSPPLGAYSAQSLRRKNRIRSGQTVERDMDGGADGDGNGDGRGGYIPLEELARVGLYTSADDGGAGTRLDDVRRRVTDKDRPHPPPQLPASTSPRKTSIPTSTMHANVPVERPLYSDSCPLGFANGGDHLDGASERHLLSTERDQGELIEEPEPSVPHREPTALLDDTPTTQAQTQTQTHTQPQYQYPYPIGPSRGVPLIFAAMAASHNGELESEEQPQDVGEKTKTTLPPSFGYPSPPMEPEEGSVLGLGLGLGLDVSMMMLDASPNVPPLDVERFKVKEEVSQERRGREEAREQGEQQEKIRRTHSRSSSLARAFTNKLFKPCRSRSVDQDRPQQREIDWGEEAWYKPRSEEKKGERREGQRSWSHSRLGSVRKLMRRASVQPEARREREREREPEEILVQPAPAFTDVEEMATHIPPPAFANVEETATHIPAPAPDPPNEEASVVDSGIGSPRMENVLPPPTAGEVISTSGLPGVDDQRSREEGCYPEHVERPATPLSPQFLNKRAPPSLSKRSSVVDNHEDDSRSEDAENQSQSQSQNPSEDDPHRSERNAAIREWLLRTGAQFQEAADQIRRSRDGTAKHLESETPLPLSPPLSPTDYIHARSRRRGQRLEREPPAKIVEVVSKMTLSAEDEPAPQPKPKPQIRRVTYYPFLRHLAHPALLKHLLEYLSYYDWCRVFGVTKRSRQVVSDEGELREVVLERYLGTVGYKRWGWANEPEGLRLGIKDLHAYMQGVTMPTYEYGQLAETYLKSPKANMGILRTLGACTRAYTRVVLRVRAQAEAEERHFQPPPMVASPSLHPVPDASSGPSSFKAPPPDNRNPVYNNNRSGTIKSRASSFSSFSHSQYQSPTHVLSPPQSRSPSQSRHDGAATYTYPKYSSSASSGPASRSPLFRLRRAPLLRVFVPSLEGEWLSDASVLECEAELKRAGATYLMRPGDVVWDAAVGDEGNAGRLIWDGKYLIDLDYTYSRTGELPKYFHSLSFSPSYFHRVIRTSGNPICRIDVSPWGEEIAENLQLLQDRIKTETPQGGVHTVVRWVHRSSFKIKPPPSSDPDGSDPISIPIPNTNLTIDRGWWGTVVVEAEGTNEGLADLQDRCPGAFPARPVGGKKPVNKVFKILRERSRPGEIWIRTVREKDRLL